MSPRSFPEQGEWPATWHVTPAPVRAAGIAIGLTIVVAVLCLAFTWPAARSQPHDLPIGLVGSAAATGEIAGQLNRANPDGFKITHYGDQTALRSAIRDRNAYGGLVVSPDGVTLLSASGASPVVAQLLTQVGTKIAGHIGTALHTEDLAPMPAKDPRGAGLAAAALPLTVAGLLPALVLLPVFPRQGWMRLIATALFSILVGLTVAGLLRFVFGSVEHNSLGVAAGLALGVAAMSFVLLGLGSLFGRIGLGAGVLLAVLLGNPLSGLASAPEMLPRGWGALGQLLPQGANATLLRSTAYFSGPARPPRSWC